MESPKRRDRYGAYHRVSQLGGRDPDSDSYVTEKMAWEKIDGWAKMHAGDVEVVERYLDRDVSGKSMSRPALDQLLADLRAGRIDGIAVAQVDRLSRADTGEALKVVSDINDIAPGKLAILDLGLDPATDTGEMILTVLLALARMQWKRYRAQWRYSRKRKLEEGWHLGIAPFGYTRNEAINEKTGKVVISEKTGEVKLAGPLIRDTTMTPLGIPAYEVVTEVFRRRAAGETFALIRDWLNESGVRTKEGNRWAANSIQALVRKPTYLGIASGGHGGDEGKPDAHPALTDEATWLAAQERVGMRKDTKESPTVIRGLVRCAGCRYSMRLSKGKSRGYEGWQFYCTRDYDSKDCPDPTQIIALSNGHVALDNYVVERMWQYLRQREEEKKIRFKAVSNADDARVKGIRDEIDKLERERSEDAVDPDFERSIGGRAARNAHLARLTGRIDALKAQIKEELRDEGKRQRPVAELMKEWEHMSMDDKRLQLASVVRYVFVRPRGDGVKKPTRSTSEGSRRDYLAGRVHIVWANDPEVEIPRQGFRGRKLPDGTNEGYVIKPFVWTDTDPGDAGVASA
jgi:DNA invertase Pin-like site-specific DNA recombinase